MSGQQPGGAAETGAWTLLSASPEPYDRGERGRPLDEAFSKLSRLHQQSPGETVPEVRKRRNAFPA